MDDSLSLKLFVGVSIASIIFGVRYLYSYSSSQKFRQYVKRIRHKIRKGWKNNPAIERLNVKCENILVLKEYKDIQFYVKVIASEKFAKVKEEIPIPGEIIKPKAKFDPFDRKNSQQLLIEPLSETHDLLYNKFPLVPFHTLVVTKEFQKQMSLINQADFEASLKIMKAMDCFIFFNGGPDAGASQEHKHLQAIPYSSFPNQTLPLDALINATKVHGEKIDKIEYATISAFKFQHVLCIFDRSVIFWLDYENLNERAKIVEKAYLESMKRLGNLDLTKAYNFILTKHWMFVVLRKCEVALNAVKINAVGFTGSFAVRSDSEYEFIRRQDPINILHAVTFPI